MKKLFLMLGLLAVLVFAASAIYSQLQRGTPQDSYFLDTALSSVNFNNDASKYNAIFIQVTDTGDTYEDSLEVRSIFSGDTVVLPVKAIISGTKSMLMAAKDATTWYIVYWPNPGNIHVVRKNVAVADNNYTKIFFLGKAGFNWSGY